MSAELDNPPNEAHTPTYSPIRKAYEISESSLHVGDDGSKSDDVCDSPIDGMFQPESPLLQPTNRDERHAEGQQSFHLDELNSDALLEAYERANGTPRYKQYMQSTNEVEEEKSDIILKEIQRSTEDPKSIDNGVDTKEERNDDPFAIYEALRDKKEQMKASGTYTLETDPFVLYSAEKAKNEQKKFHNIPSEPIQASKNEYEEVHTKQEPQDDNSFQQLDLEGHSSEEFSNQDRIDFIDTAKVPEEPNELENELMYNQKFIEDREYQAYVGNQDVEKMREDFSANEYPDIREKEFEKDVTEVKEEPTSNECTSDPDIKVEIGDFENSAIRTPRSRENIENHDAHVSDLTDLLATAQKNICDLQSENTYMREKIQEQEKFLLKNQSLVAESPYRSANEQLQDLLNVTSDINGTEKRDFFSLLETERSNHAKTQKELVNLQMSSREEIQDMKHELSIAQSVAAEAQKKLEECMRANSSLANRMENHEGNIGRGIISSIEKMRELIETIPEEVAALRSEIHSLQLDPKKEPKEKTSSMSEALLKLAGGTSKPSETVKAKKEKEVKTTPPSNKRKPAPQPTSKKGRKK